MQIFVVDDPPGNSSAFPPSYMLLLHVAATLLGWAALPKL
jgi:hypothetical protein